MLTTLLITGILAVVVLIVRSHLQDSDDDY